MASSTPLSFIDTPYPVVVLDLSFFVMPVSENKMPDCIRLGKNSPELNDWQGSGTAGVSLWNAV